MKERAMGMDRGMIKGIGKLIGGFISEVGGFFRDVFILMGGGGESKVQERKKTPQARDSQSENAKKTSTLDIGVSFLKPSITDKDRCNVDKVVAAVRKTGEDERLHGLPGVSRIQAIERAARENTGYANGRGARPER